MTLRNAALTAVPLLATPATALACPLCYGSLAPRVLHAYYLSTAFLSLLPFTVAGTLAFVAYRVLRRVREAERAEQAEATRETS